MIIVLKGGTSAERQVSMWTAASFAQALRFLKLEFKEIDAADTNWIDQTIGSSPEIVLIALHGPYGEDGTVQRILEKNKIAFIGSDSIASSIAIDKTKMKQLVAELGIAVPKSATFIQSETIFWNGEFPVVVKPNKGGSSYGVSVADNDNTLQSAVAEAITFGSEILVEEFIDGREFSCAIILMEGQQRALPIVEILHLGKLFDFEAKYNNAGCVEVCPAEIDGSLARRIQDASIVVFNSISCRHYARCDWIVRDNVLYFLEIITLPGMTKTSLLPKELLAAGIAFPSFLYDLIQSTKLK